MNDNQFESYEPTDEDMAKWNKVFEDARDDPEFKIHDFEFWGWYRNIKVEK